jgi:transketolase C-terminal domain/subunit
MKEFMPQTLIEKGPIYIRLGKDSDPKPTIPAFDPEKSILIYSTGIMTDRMRLVENANIIHCPLIKPFSNVKDDITSSTKLIVTAEEGIINGGLGSAVLECLADNNIQIPVLRFGLPDAFPHHYGEQEDLLETYGLTPKKMAARIKEFYEVI